MGDHHASSGSKSPYWAEGDVALMKYLFMQMSQKTCAIGLIAFQKWMSLFFKSIWQLQAHQLQHYIF